MEQTYKLFDAEYRFMDLVWEEQPVASGELVRLCEERLGWKKSTTYTVLRKLCIRGILQNCESVVTALVGREEAQRFESRALVEKSFGGSLPQFLTAFLGGSSISEQEAEELRRIIDRFEAQEKEGGE
jgi:predicted transcriptional regulator